MDQSALRLGLKHSDCDRKHSSGSAGRMHFAVLLGSKLNSHKGVDNNPDRQLADSGDPQNLLGVGF